MSGLARFGHIARGITQGVQDYQRMQDNQLALREREQRMGLNDALMQRQQRQWAKQDDDEAAMAEANEAARKSLEDDRKAFETQAQGLGAPQSYRPGPRALLGAAQAKADALFKRGRMDLGLAQWEKNDAVLERVRGEAGQKALAAIASGGDVESALRDLDDAADDGLSVASVKPIKRPDGSLAYEIRHKNRLTGKAVEQPTVASPQELEKAVTMLLADPKETRKHLFAAYLENLKSSNDRAESEQKHRQTMKEIGARGDEAQETARIRVNGTVTAAQIRKSGGGGAGGTGSNVARTVDNADGTRTIIFRNGDAKTLIGDDGKPLIGAHAERALQGLTSQIGKTVEGSLATPEANRARAANMLPKPSALPKGLPAGSRQIGTSGGKPVYQTPDGKKFIVE